jgi:hypothetical protein
MSSRWPVKVVTILSVAVPALIGLLPFQAIAQQGRGATEALPAAPIHEGCMTPVQVSVQMSDEAPAIAPDRKDACGVAGTSGQKSANSALGHGADTSTATVGNVASATDGVARGGAGYPLLELGQTWRGVLEEGDQRLAGEGPVESIDFIGLRGQTITITARSDELDTAIEITDFVEYSASNDDGPGIGTNSSLTVTLPDEACYTVRVFLRGPRHGGAYELSITGPPPATPSRGEARVGASDCVPPPPVAGPLQTAPVDLRQPLAGVLGASDRRAEDGHFEDEYPILGYAGQRILIEVASTAFQPRLSVRGPSGATVGNEPSTAPGIAWFEIELPADGVYRIAVSATAANGTGEYRLFVDDEAVPLITMAPVIDPLPPRQVREGAQPLTAGQPVRGALTATDQLSGTGRFVDVYSFEGRAGQLVRLTMTSDLFDTMLSIETPQGSTHGNDDAEGMGTNAQLLLWLPVDGVYEVRAHAYRTGDTGDYTLTFEQLVPPETALLVAGEPVQGSLATTDRLHGAANYVDLYALEGRAGDRVVLTMTSSDLDTLLMLEGPDGRMDESDDAPGMGTNSQLDLTLPADGVYKVRAMSFNAGDTGHYTLTLEVQPTPR